MKFEPPDIMGIPPDPLPVPLFSGGMFSSGIPSGLALQFVLLFSVLYAWESLLLFQYGIICLIMP